MERGLTSLLMGRVLPLNCLQVDKRFSILRAVELPRAKVLDLVEVGWRHRIQLFLPKLDAPSQF